MIAEIRSSFVLVQFFFLQIKVHFISYTIVRVYSINRLLPFVMFVIMPAAVYVSSGE